MHDPSVSLWDLRTIPLWSKWTKDLTLYCLNKIKEIMILVLQKGYKTDYLVNRHNMMGTVSKLYVSNNTWIYVYIKKNFTKFQLQFQLPRVSTPIPTPTPGVSTPTPTPASLLNINSNSRSFNSNSNSNSGQSPEYQLQLQLQRFQLQFQLQLRSWSWNWTQLQLQLPSWPQPWQAIIRANVNTDLCHHMASLGLEATMYENWKSF